MKVGSRRSLTACSHRWARCRRRDGGYVVSDIGGGVSTRGPGIAMTRDASSWSIAAARPFVKSVLAAKRVLWRMVCAALSVWCLRETVRHG